MKSLGKKKVIDVRRGTGCVGESGWSIGREGRTGCCMHQEGMWGEFLRLEGRTDNRRKSASLKLVAAIDLKVSIVHGVSNTY